MAAAGAAAAAGSVAGRAGGALGGEADRADAEARQNMLEQVIGTAIHRLAVQYNIARAEKLQQRCADRRHAAAKHRAGLGLVPERQPVFEDLEVGIV